MEAHKLPSCAQAELQVVPFLSALALYEAVDSPAWLFQVIALQASSVLLLTISMWFPSDR